MKGRVVILDDIDDREAAALMVDGVLHDLLIDPTDLDQPMPGAIYRGVAERPLKGQGGVIVRLPDGKGFLRHAKGIAPGETLLVQVAGTAEPGKAAPVTQRILFKSRYAIVTPGAPGINVSKSIRDDEARERLLEIAHETMAGAPDGLGLILRSAAEGAEADAVAGDIDAMRGLAEAMAFEGSGPPELLVGAPGAHELAWRDWATPEPDEVVDAESSFETHGVMEAVTEALSPRIELGANITAYIEPTRALIAVDVNTGGDTSLAAGLKANLAVARALPRLLRIKGLAGQITVDFAPSPKKDRRVLEDVLRKAFRSDGSDVVLAGWTPLGHYELQRKRDRLPLAQIWPKGF